MAKRAAALKSVVETDAGIDTQSDSPSPSVSGRREAAKVRHVSLKEAASLLDRDRNTIMKWIDAGCPFVEKADRDLGKAWVLDIADIVRWLEDRSARLTAEKLGVNAEGAITEEEAKRRRAVAQAVIAEIEASEVLKTVVRTSAAIERVASDYAEIRSKMMAVPDAIAGRVEQRVSGKVRSIADEIIRLALESLKVDRELAASEGRG